MTGKKLVLISLGFFFISGISLFFFTRLSQSPWQPLPFPQTPTPTPTPKPLLKYTFDALSSYLPNPSQIEIGAPLDYSTNTADTYLFSYQTESKNMSGMLTIPKVATPSAGFPVIIMSRGFVDPAMYVTGLGTKNAALRLADAGFVTLAPDFFGFGTSDDPNPDVMGERLQKPLNLLDLIASLRSLSFVNPDQLGLWGHSNGGQITLSLLEITSKSYPTVLWAPVSKPFPYSILFYTDEYDDQGKALRATLSDFEAHYDVFDFSIDRYVDRITAPIQIHQGTSDDAVPYHWSQELADRLEAEDLEPQLFLYPGADHNLRPDWETVMVRTIDFYTQYLFQ